MSYRSYTTEIPAIGNLLLELPTLFLVFVCACLLSKAALGQKWELADTELDDQRSGKVLKGTAEGTMENPATNDGACSIEIYIYEGATTNHIELKILKYGESPEIMKLYNTYSIEFRGNTNSRKKAFRLMWNKSGDKLFPAIRLGNKYVYQDDLLRYMLTNDSVECVIEHRIDLLPHAKYKFAIGTNTLRDSLNPILSKSLKEQNLSKKLATGLIEETLTPQELLLFQEWDTLKQGREWNSKAGKFSVKATFDRFLPDEMVRLRETGSRRIIDVNVNVFSDADQQYLAKLAEIGPVIAGIEEKQKKADQKKKALDSFTTGWKKYTDICVEHDDEYIRIVSDPDSQEFEKVQQLDVLYRKWLDHDPIDIKLMFLLSDSWGGNNYRGYYYNNWMGYPAKIKIAVGRNNQSGYKAADAITHGTLMVYTSKIGFGYQGEQYGVISFNPSTPLLKSGEDGKFPLFSNAAKDRGLVSMESSVSYALGKIRPATEEEKALVPELKQWLEQLHEKEIAPRSNH